MKTDEVGFVGLGAMGGRMARQLLDKGFSLRVYDTRPEALAPFSNDDVVTAENLSEIAQNCNWIMLSLPDGEVVDQVLNGAGGLRPCLESGQIVVDCSTIPPHQAVAVAADFEKVGSHFLDAPVTGMEERAENGTLTVMVGGDAAAFESVRPLLEGISTVVVHMGPPGFGQITKAINNVLYNISCAAMAEMLPFAVHLGLAPEKVRQVVSSGSGQSFGFDFFSKLALAGEFTTGYAMGSAFKDFKTVMGRASELETPLPVASAAMQTYMMALAQGLGEESKGAMIKVWEQMTGIEVRNS